MSYTVTVRLLTPTQANHSSMSLPCLNSFIWERSKARYYFRLYYIDLLLLSHHKTNVSLQSKRYIVVGIDEIVNVYKLDRSAAALETKEISVLANRSHTIHQ